MMAKIRYKYLFDFWRWNALCHLVEGPGHNTILAAVAVVVFDRVGVFFAAREVFNSRVAFDVILSGQGLVDCCVHGAQLDFAFKFCRGGGPDGREVLACLLYTSPSPRD